MERRVHCIRTHKRGEFDPSGTDAGVAKGATGECVSGGEGAGDHEVEWERRRGWCFQRSRGRSSCQGRGFGRPTGSVDDMSPRKRPVSLEELRKDGSHVVEGEDCRVWSRGLATNLFRCLI